MDLGQITCGLNKMAEARGNLVLAPLYFPEEISILKEHDYCLIDRLKDIPLPCLVCEETLNNPESAREDFLKHLLEEHRIVIHNANVISSMKRYAGYWKSRLKEKPITDFMTVIRSYSTPSRDGPGEDYFLLSDVIKEDSELRKQLHLQRLKAILSVQEHERRDKTFNRMCLFCSATFPERIQYFEHMKEQHNFNIGHADNIVFVADFLEALQQKLEKFQCLYCDKYFKDRPTLKDHMRKKQHRKLDPKNTSYDKYYMVNYLEQGKTWREISKEKDHEVISHPSAKEDSDLSDWTEENPALHCLFCAKSLKEWPDMKNHFLVSHNFTTSSSSSGEKLDFYSQVKAVNYIRRQVYFKRCPKCDLEFSETDVLQDHMKSTSHSGLPSDSRTWNQTQYLFSTYENDALLYCLDEEEEESKQNDTETQEDLETSPLPEEAVETLLGNHLLTELYRNENVDIEQI